jgi:tRNA pseudouridine38-40 synthase
VSLTGENARPSDLVGASNTCPEAVSQRASLHRLWAKVEYDGTDFFGFQVQAVERTIQGEIERALEAITGVETRVRGAGRTDRGVHARGQVIGFEVRWKHSLRELQRALNAILAADVAIVEMGVASQLFHPRFDALSRTYRYTLLNQAGRSPLARRRAWHVEQWLDVVPMAQASGCLVGSHDFGAFGRPPQGQNCVRRVLRAEWKDQPPFLEFDIEANAFLYRMVRSIVGTLVLVGNGQVSVEEFETILASKDRSQVRQVAPARGLCLMQVDYAIPKESCSEDLDGQNSRD